MSRNQLNGGAAMHAVVFNVDMTPGWEGDVEAELDMLVKTTKETEGHVRGLWASNDQHGISIQLYETEEAAREVSENVGEFPPDASVVFRSVEVYEVAREA
jgi:hypothetical protein